jgi:hypothetical protein
MAEQPISLLPLYQGWGTYQELLIKAIEPLSNWSRDCKPPGTSFRMRFPTGPVPI